MCKKRVFETPLERRFGRRPFITVAWGDAPGRWVQPSCFWPKAILTSAVMPKILGEYGLRPNNSNTHDVLELRFKQEHNRWAKDLVELELSNLGHASLAQPISIAVDADTYTASTTVKLPGGNVISLRILHNGRVLSP